MDAKKIYLECEQHSKEQLKSDVKYLNNVINILQQENQALKKKYENAVADYEYEKSKNQRAIEYINDLSLDFYDYECEQLIVGKHMINDLLKILKEDSKDVRE